MIVVKTAETRDLVYSISLIKTQRGNITLKYVVERPQNTEIRYSETLFEQKILKLVLSNTKQI